jgi:tRNA(Ile)-lysidine synthase
MGAPAAVPADHPLSAVASGDRTVPSCNRAVPSLSGALPSGNGAVPSGDGAVHSGDGAVHSVLAAVTATGVLGGPAPVVVMLSGGRDSVCLLDVATALLGTSRVVALHVNYGLRGADSDADEAHCAALCADLGVVLHRVPAGPAGSDAGNLQAWARDLRYRAANDIAADLDAAGSAHRGALVAAGHTATDQVETILYRLAASPGRRALLGMAPRDGRLVRPLLDLTRQHTAAYCLARRLTWRDDASNESQRFARVRVRNGLVGALSAVHPAATSNVLRTAALLRDEAHLLDGLVDRELAGAQEIAIARLASLHPALARLVVRRLAEDATGGYAPQAAHRVDDILALARRLSAPGSANGRARVQLHVGGSAAAVVQEGVLRMIALPPRPRGRQA